MKVTSSQDTLNWYNNNVVTYSQSIKDLVATKQINDFIALLPNNKKVLDAGCAAGRDSRALSNNGAIVIGLDLSPELLRIARSESPNITYLEGNFLSLPFENDTFGGIWSHASLLHCKTVNEVMRALKEFYRVLEKGGILHIYLKVNTQNKKFDIVSDKLSHHDRFFQYFTNEELKDMLSKNGFRLIKIENEEDQAGRKEVRWVCSLSRK